MNSTLISLLRAVSCDSHGNCTIMVSLLQLLVLKLCIIIIITIRLLSPKLSNKQKKTRKFYFLLVIKAQVSQVSHVLTFAILGAGQLPILQLGKSETAFLGPPAAIGPKWKVSGFPNCNIGSNIAKVKK